MKKILKFIGIGFLGIVALFVVIGALTSLNSVDNDEVFLPYIEESVPKFSTWDIKIYKDLMSEEGFNSTSVENWNKYIGMFSRLGDFVSLGVPKYETGKTMMTTSKGAVNYAVYLVPVMYSTGQAHVQISLEHNNDEVKTLGIKFLSDIFIQ